MRGRVHAINTLKGLVADLRSIFLLWLFKHHPHTCINLAFMPNDASFLHCRQIAFYRTLCHRQCFRHFFSSNKWVGFDGGQDKPLTFSKVRFRHIPDIIGVISAIYIAITVNDNQCSADMILDCRLRKSHLFQALTYLVNATSPWLDKASLVEGIGYVAIARL